MRIAYCDDEKAQYIFLKELTDQWEKETRIPCDTTVYESAEEMLFENQATVPFDFIILDIELNKMNGIDLGRRIRELDHNVMIAFLSNSREYVFEGYEVGAVRYLMKPLSKEQLFPLLNMVKKSLEEEKQYIIIGISGDKIKLVMEEIGYIEALGHYIAIHTNNQTYEVKMNINDIFEKLNKDFVSTHRSFLVNLSWVDRITKTDCILSSGQIVPISRNSYRDVNQAFIEFYRGGVI